MMQQVDRLRPVGLPDHPWDGDLDEARVPRWLSRIDVCRWLGLRSGVQAGQMKQQENPNLWACAACVIVISALFAAVPFWIRGIDLRDATIVSAIVFPTVAAAFTYAIWREWNQ